MSETINKKRKSRKSDENTVPVDITEANVEALEGFTPQEVVRLAKVKADIAKGRYSDVTDEHRKLLFVDWLIEHGRLKS